MFLRPLLPRTLSGSLWLLIPFLSCRLQATCAEGAVYTLTVPWLQLLSRVSVFPSNPTSLLCSPDLQWVFASTQNSDLSPEVSGRLCPLPQGAGFVHKRGGSRALDFWGASGGAASHVGPNRTACMDDDESSLTFHSHDCLLRATS